MKLFNLFKKTQPASTATGAGEFPFLVPPDQFSSVLEQERLRADRTDIEFALIVFRFESSDVSDEQFPLFARCLHTRLRATDRAGLCGEHGRNVGVILWDTNAAGVRTFLNSLQQLMPTLELPEHEVYLYPTDPPYTDRGRTGGNESENAGDNGKPKLTRNNIHDPLPRIKPLERLFLKPLPMWKRAIDIFGASFGLIVLSPLLLGTAALIKLTSKGPVFFRQQRDGLGGRPFTIYKFRTMFLDAEARKEALRKHSEQDGPAFKMTNDPRITPLGRYLRKTCIDELPQLWNVLKGDMTLVGPRPLDSREARQITGWGRRRMEVTPGLTCIWQVEGKSRVTFTEWMRMDVRYLTSRSFLQDIKLIWRTAVSVMLHRASV